MIILCFFNLKNVIITFYNFVCLWHFMPLLEFFLINITRLKNNKLHGLYNIYYLKLFQIFNHFKKKNGQ